VYVLGHFGIAIGLAWLLAWKRGPAVDYRLVLLGAMLPDLIDKPLGVALGLETRLWAHSLVFFVSLLALSWIRSLRPLLWVAFGVATHLLLDRIWAMPWVVLWPALGWTFPPDGATLWGFVEPLLADPFVIAGEVAGAIILILFAGAHGIRSWSALRLFLRNGRVAKAAGGRRRGPTAPQ